MRSLMRYARQLGQRRTIAFYLSPDARQGTDTPARHIFMSGRQRSLRELFSEAEYGPEDNDVPDDPHPNED